MDYSNFSNEQLEDMLKSQKEKLAHMILISGLEAVVERIKEIEFTLQERKENDPETK